MHRATAAFACSVLFVLFFYIGPSHAEVAILSGPLAELDGRYLLLDEIEGAVELQGDALEPFLGKRVWVSGNVEVDENGAPVLTVDEIELIQPQE